MTVNVPRHLNKKPLIAGLEPIELLGVAAILIVSNIISKMFELTAIVPAVISIVAFSFLKLFKRGKARGYLQHLLQFQIRSRVRQATTRKVEK